MGAKQSTSEEHGNNLTSPRRRRGGGSRLNLQRFRPTDVITEERQLSLLRFLQRADTRGSSGTIANFLLRHLSRLRPFYSEWCCPVSPQVTAL